jgi:hypothetical protein
MVNIASTLINIQLNNSYINKGQISTLIQLQITEGLKISDLIRTIIQLFVREESHSITIRVKLQGILMGYMNSLAFLHLMIIKILTIFKPIPLAKEPQLKCPHLFALKVLRAFHKPKLKIFLCQKISSPMRKRVFLSFPKSSLKRLAFSLTLHHD